MSNYIVRGAVGLSKAALKIDRSSEETIKSRKLICNKCEYFKRVNTKFSGKDINTSKCMVCGCFIAAKVLINSEKCPKNKW